MMAIDADAHVIETEQTWAYLDPDDRKYGPLLVAPSAESNRGGRLPLRGGNSERQRSPRLPQGDGKWPGRCRRGRP